MLKAGTKRRRTKAEIEAFKLEEQKKEEQARHSRQRINQLEEKVLEAQTTADEHASSTIILTQFHEQGLLRQNAKGHWEVVQQKAQEVEGSMPGVEMHDQANQKKEAKPNR